MRYCRGHQMMQVVKSCRAGLDWPLKGKAAGRQQFFISNSSCHVKLGPWCNCRSIGEFLLSITCRSKWECSRLLNWDSDMIPWKSFTVWLSEFGFRNKVADGTLSSVVWPCRLDPKYGWNADLHSYVWSESPATTFAIEFEPGTVAMNAFEENSRCEARWNSYGVSNLNTAIAAMYVFTGIAIWWCKRYLPDHAVV